MQNAGQGRQRNNTDEVQAEYKRIQKTPAGGMDGCLFYLLCVE
jgi:hypothetical protein